MKKNEAIHELMGRFLSHDISRRNFIRALGAVGISSDGISSMLKGTQVAASGKNTGGGYTFTGTGGQLMVEQLKALGVEYIFTNPGTFEVGFFDACLDQPLRVILCLHEGIVVAAADGYAKVSKKPGVINVHAFAAAQAAGQLYNAHCDHTPLVVTSGMRINTSRSNSPQTAWPEWTMDDVPHQFTKMTWLCQSAKELPAQIRRAVKVAKAAPGGPVYLAATEEAQTTKNVSALIYTSENFITHDSISPSPDLLVSSARALLEARSPVIWLGDQVTKDESYGEALELAELLSIPVCDSWVWGSFANFPHRHPLYAGYYDGRGKDLVLAFGIDQFDDPRMYLSETTTMIQGSTYGNALNRSNPGDISITANTKLVLRGLIDAVKSMATETRIRRIADSRKGQEPDFGGEAALGYEAEATVGPIPPDVLGVALELELDRNCIFIDENLQGSKRFLSFGPGENAKMLVQNSGGCLGWGVGAALGAKIAAPNRQVVLSIGDGSVMYSAAGFWTMARYEIPVLTIVSNNHSYETVRQAYGKYNGKMAAADRFMATVLDSPLIDFAGLAKAEGCDGIRVDNESDLRPAIRRGIEATRAGIPFLIDVDVARAGVGADSTWFQAFSVAQSRKVKV